MKRKIGFVFSILIILFGTLTILSPASQAAVYTSYPCSPSTAALWNLNTGNVNLYNSSSRVCHGFVTARCNNNTYQNWFPTLNPGTALTRRMCATSLPIRDLWITIDI